MRLHKIIFTALALVFFLKCVSQENKKDINSIKEAMQKQQEAWNSFDIEGFMSYYWKSDSLKFIGSKGITYGWQKTLDNYKKGYPSKEAMGELTFENIEFKQVSKKYIYVIGKWHLKRKEGNNVGGHYTLLWEKINGKWLIIIDHTS